MNKSHDYRAIGREAEAIAADHLVQKGYRIVRTNYCVRGGELDIIAENDTYLIFVEVKSRDKSYVPGYGRPALAVTERKKRLVVQTAQLYLRAFPSGKKKRIDVIEVVTDRTGGPPSVKHMENAFDATGRSIYERSRYRY